MNKGLTLLAAAAALVPAAAQAATHTINFDDVASGTVINTHYQASQGISFTSIYNYFPATNVEAVSDVSGSAPNSLDAASYGGVNVLLDSGLNPGANFFQIDLLADPQGSGVSNVTLDAYDKFGNLIASLTSIDETVPQTLILTTNAAIAKVVLPGGAYYDNLTVAATPEPATAVPFVLGGLALLGLARRAKKQA